MASSQRLDLLMRHPPDSPVPRRPRPACRRLCQGRRHQLRAAPPRIASARKGFHRFAARARSRAPTAGAPASPGLLDHPRRVSICRVTLVVRVDPTIADLRTCQSESSGRKLDRQRRPQALSRPPSGRLSRRLVMQTASPAHPRRRSWQGATHTTTNRDRGGCRNQSLATGSQPQSRLSCSRAQVRCPLPRACPSPYTAARAQGLCLQADRMTPPLSTAAEPLPRSVRRAGHVDPAGSKDQPARLARRVRKAHRA